MNKSKFYPLVSIVIVTCNRRKLVLDCLGSIFRCNYPCLDIVVIENGSNDVTEADMPTFAYVGQRDCRVIHFDHNMGFAIANNVGVDVSRGKYVFLLNNDTLVDPNCVQQLVRVMESDQTLGAVQPKLLIPTHPITIDSMGYIVDRSGWGVSVGHNEVDDGSFDKLRTISYGKGAALFCRKDVIKQTGLFDPDFFFLSEDFDLCWRVWMLGYRVLSFPTAKVIHRVSSTMSSISPQIRYYHQFKNLIATLLKNYALSSLVPCFLLSYAVHFVYYLSFPRKERVGAVKGFFNATKWLLSNVQNILRKRSNVQKHIRRLPDHAVLNMMMSGHPLFIEAVFRNVC